MKMNKIFLIFVLFAFPFKSYCSDSDSTGRKFHFGLLGGLTQNTTFTGDVFSGLTLHLKSKKFEANFGYTYFKNKTDFDDVGNILYYSHGIFGEGNLYLISNFFTGIRLSINLNSIDKESQSNYDKNSEKKPPTLFTGIAAYGQFGYNQPIGKKMNIMILGRIGMHNFTIANGELYFSNSNSPSTDDYTEENQTKLLYNVSLGFTIRL